MHQEILRFDGIELHWNNEKTFQSIGSDGTTLDFKLNALDASFADVRDRDIKSQALKSAKWNQKLWLTTLVSVAGLFVVAVIALANWIWSIGLQSKMDQVEERQTKVEAIEAKERNLQVLKVVQQRSFSHWQCSILSTVSVQMSSILEK